MNIGTHWPDEVLDLLGLEMLYPADASNSAFAHDGLVPRYVRTPSAAKQVPPGERP